VSKKDRTPPEIAEIRRRREGRRILTGTVIMAVWLLVFTVGSVTGSYAVMWVAFALCMTNLVIIYGLHEKALRKIADRPAPDYNKIWKLQKRELPESKHDSIAVNGEDSNE